MIIFIRILLAALVLVLFIKRGDIFAFLGGYYHNKKDYEKSAKFYGIGAKVGAMSFKNRIKHAYALLESGNVIEASKRFNLLSMEQLTKGQLLEVNEYWAMCFWKQDEKDKAIEMLEEAVSKTPSVNIYETLGMMYVLNGNLATAREFNTKAHQELPDSKKILNNLAYTHLMMQDYTLAEEYYTKLFASKPDFPDGYFEYGKYLVETGDIGKGMNSIKLALECDFPFLSHITRKQVEDYLAKATEPETEEDSGEDKDGL